jgi:glycosyltransferase involved in cell wall biosynthesis
MNEQVEWIKKCLRISANLIDVSEQEKHNCFLELKGQYRSFSKEQIQYIREVIHHTMELQDIFYLFSFFVNGLKLEEYWEEILKIVTEEQFDCYTGSILELQLLIAEKGSYVQKRCIHRKNVYKFWETLNLGYSYIPYKDRNKKRIVIITEQIIQARTHSPTNIIINTIYILKKYMGYEVLLYAVPSNMPIPLVWYDAHGYTIGEETGSFVFHGVEISVTRVCMTDGIESYRQMMKEIYAWRPSFVLSMGVDNPVADVPRMFTTVATVKMTVDNPVSEAQVLVFSKNADLLTQEEREQMLTDQRIFVEKKNMPPVYKNTGKHCLRSEFDLPEQRFLVAIVGIRLEQEITEEFAGIMHAIIERASNIDFAIIGTGAGVIEALRTSEFENRIHYMGYCEDLFSVYGMMDLYLNPKRGGGGFSGAMAIKAGLPVVTLPDCDVAFQVPTEFVVNDENEMIETVYRYAQDKEYYRKIRQRTEAYMTDDFDEKMMAYVKDLIENIESCIEV